MKPIKILCILLCLYGPPRSLQASEGEALYLENCAVCHGSDGRGGVGVPLSLPAFLKQSPDEYLKRSIRFGRPGRIMPAFTHLSERQVELIVRHVRGWDTGRPAPAWNDNIIKGDVRKGEALYTRHCRQCHGEEGRGGKGTGVMFSRKKDLPIMAPAIGNPGFLYAANDSMIRDIILHGRPGTPMRKARQFKLSDADVDDLVGYIRSLEKPLQSTPQQHEQEAPVLVYDSPYDFEETVNNVRRAAVGMNFRLIHEQAIDQGLVVKADENRKQTLVYFCNFDFLYRALAIDPRVGLFLPCRITITENRDRVQVMSVNPRRLGRLFNNHELDKACNKMYRLYTRILEEATF